MFAGIVEAVAQVQKIEERPGRVIVQVERPQNYTDIALGDSIAVNGVCLTVEKFDQASMTFSLGAETLRLLGSDFLEKPLNLERSLRFGDRIHGHLVTGHVEALGEVVRSQAQGESWFLDVRVPKNILRFVWPKGSITLHGVSLTVNSIDKDIVGVCLVPETQKRTNLTELKTGHSIHLEADYMAKAVTHAAEFARQNGEKHV